MPSASLAQAYTCLPDDVDRRSLDTVRTTSGTTLRRALRSVRARCSRRAGLVISSGRPIKIFQRQDCWGNPPAEPERSEIVRAQEGEIRKLKRRYYVIQIACNDLKIN